MTDAKRGPVTAFIPEEAWPLPWEDEKTPEEIQADHVRLMVEWGDQIGQLKQLIQDGSREAAKAQEEALYQAWALKHFDEMGPQ